MKKLIASAFLVIALFGVSMVCASAAAQDPSTGNGFTVVGTAHFVPYSGEVDTASALSDIVAALMSSDQALDYLSVYNSSTSYVFMPNYVVNIKYNSTHNCYGIFLTSKSYSGWLHTGSATAGRYMIYCPPEKFEPDLLYSISRATSAISSKVSTISDTLSSFQSNTQNALVKIYSKLSGISDSVSTGVNHLNSINNYLSGDFSLYIQSIESSVIDANSSLGQLSTKMDSVVDTLTTENGKNSLFYPITRRLDSIISSLGSSSVNTGSLRYWRVSDDSIGSLNFSNIGYDALSSLMETVTESYLDYQVVSGDTRYYLDSVDSFSIVHTTVGNTTGYFIQCVGKYRQSVNGINQFFDGVFYLTEKNSTIFYASDDSRGATGSTDLSTVHRLLTTISNHLSALTTIPDKLTYLFGEYEGTYQFPLLGTAPGTVDGVSASAFSVLNYDESLLLFSDKDMVSVVEGTSSGGDFSGNPYTLRNLGTRYWYHEVIPMTPDLINYLESSNIRPHSAFKLVRTINVFFVDIFDVTVEATFGDDSVTLDTIIEPVWSDPNDLSCNTIEGFTLGWFDSVSYSLDYSVSWPRFYRATDINSNMFGTEPYLYFYSVCSDPFAPHDCTHGSYPVLFSSRFTNFVYGQIDRVINAINSSGGGASADLTSVTTRLDTIIEQLQTTSGESGCDHTYTQDVTQAPTCILPGLQVSTCSQCGDSYSEILAALGHDWQCTSHVEAVTDPDTGEVTQSGYDIYTCSRCGDTYNDYAGDGAPSDYGDTSLSKIIVKLFSKLGTFAGKIISWIIGLFDKMLSGLNDIITRFSDLTAQITGFGGDYPSWLSGFWGILPQEFQLALTFSFVCVFIGVIGRKLFFA